MVHSNSPQDKQKKFYFFHYTRKSVKDCCIAIDTFDHGSDSQRGDLACRQCQFFCWPMTLVFDVITVPYRGPKHLIKKCCGKNKK